MRLVAPGRTGWSPDLNSSLSMTPSVARDLPRDERRLCRVETQGQARRISPALSEPEVALHMLAEEMATYRAHLPGLLQGQQSQYVLIKGTDVVGVFNDRSEALREGHQRFGVVPFLVRQIVACEPVVYLPNVVP
jgi:hypothetical protein